MSFYQQSVVVEGGWLENVLGTATSQVDNCHLILLVMKGFKKKKTVPHLPHNISACIELYFFCVLSFTPMLMILFQHILLVGYINDVVQVQHSTGSR